MPMIKSQHDLRKQNGLVIVMLVLVIVVLLGIAAMALDLGRLYVLKSEMQNAADAAALAAAAELNAKDDAIERATAAAKEIVAHNSHFSKIKELLGNDVDIDITFYCSIGGTQDANATCPGAQDPDDTNKILLASPSDDDQAHYVKITLDPNRGDENDQHYGIDLYFLPVLSIFGIDTEKTAVTSATALAGRHFYFCNYPPVMMCDPFEHSGGFRSHVGVGDEILLKLQGGPNAKWAPGAFGFLDLPEGKPPVFNPAGGASQLAPKLANEGNVGCTPPMIMPETGQMATPMQSAMNTRFDEYGHPPFNYADAYKDYPPAKNITSYGDPDYQAEHDVGCPLPANYCQDNPGQPVCWRDSALRCPGGVTKIGDADWERQGYWTAKHGTAPAPATLSSMSRYDVFQYETSNGMIADEPAELTHRSVASNDRRVLFVAVLSCDALGVQPNQVFPVVEPNDGFAKLFLTERVGEPPNTNFFVEFMGWAQEDDANYHVVVQLYE